MARRQDVHGDYFEGTIQLRNPSKELIAYVKQLIEESADNWIAKEKKVKNGIDIRVASKKFLRRLPERIKEKFDGIAKTSTTLFSRNRQTSKDIHRVTVMFKLASFKRDEVLVIRGIEMKVQSVGDKCKLQEVKSGKKHILPFDEIQEAGMKK